MDDIKFTFYWNTLSKKCVFIMPFVKSSKRQTKIQEFISDLKKTTIFNIYDHGDLLQRIWF